MQGLWYEINYGALNIKWFKFAKGGAYRKWYGNIDYVVNWLSNGLEIKNYVKKKYPYLKGNYGLVVKNENTYFSKGILTSRVTSGNLGFRIKSEEELYSDACTAIFPNECYYLLGLVSTKILEIVKQLNPTLNFQASDLERLPVRFDHQQKPHIENLVEENIGISKIDYDSYETSWGFIKHPLIHWKVDSGKIKDAYENWQHFTDEHFSLLKTNEEELNHIFIDIYGLQDELKPEVEDKDITIRKADQSRDIKSFISYAVGCMMGRYSLDEEGLVLAGGKFNSERYKTFKADADGILPVLSDAYFEDDIVTQFSVFMKVTFGENTLVANLDYIAETLGRKANESSRECIRRYFLKDFYKDHVQMYKKRPIYWLFTSGKEQGFNALVYMHRYDSSMVSRVRTDYLHPLQNKLEAEFLRLNQVMVSEDSPTEKTKATKRLKVLSKQMEELKKYDEVIHNLADQQIEIDLDDGVVVNYAKFEKVLAKI